MSRRSEEMDHVYIIYSISCKHLEEVHDLCVKGNSSEEVHLVLIDRLYSERRDQNDDQSDYDVLWLTGGNAVVKALGDFLMTEVRTYLLCSSLQFYSW